MRRDPEYLAYVTALTSAVDLPRAQADETADIARRARNEIDGLDRSRREAADRWVGLRDTSARLSRRVDDLADRVGAPRVSGADDGLLSPDAVAGALESLRASVDRAEQSWQWVQRQRERAAAPQDAPPPAPVYSAPPAPVPVSSPAAPASGNTNLLIVGGAVVIVIVIVIVVLVV